MNSSLFGNNSIWYLLVSKTPRHIQNYKSKSKPQSVRDLNSSYLRIWVSSKYLDSLGIVCNLKLFFLLVTEWLPEIYLICAN